MDWKINEFWSWYENETLTWMGGKIDMVAHNATINFGKMHLVAHNETINFGKKHLVAHHETINFGKMHLVAHNETINSQKEWLIPLVCPKSGWMINIYPSGFPNFSQ